MKKFAKALLVVLCALILVVGSVFGTLAYLTSQDEVVNTFTVGNVTITMDEAKVDEYGAAVEPAARTEDAADGKNGNVYKLIPGHTYTKDPTIHVDGTSETCWLFAKIENGLGDNAVINFAANSKWSKLVIDGQEVENIWVYADIVDAGEDVVIFESFTLNGDAVPADLGSENITVTAYAIQSDTFETPEEAWAAAPLSANP